MPPTSDEQIRFMVNIQRLLDEGLFTASYKFALLLALAVLLDTRIAAIGIAQSYCWESPKPVEFGQAGLNWENVGWKVTVGFTTLLNRGRRTTWRSCGRSCLA